MNDQKRQSDQAEGLRTKMIDEYKQEHGDYPPRSEVHKGQKSTKAKVKMKYPVIRLLALFFILLPIFILSMNVYFNGKNAQITQGDQVVGVDTVFISNGQESTNESEEVNSSDSTVEEQDSSDLESEEVVSTNTSSSENEAKVGQEDQITEDTLQTNSEETGVEEYKEIKTHKVTSGETLFTIAIEYYNSKAGMEIIRTYNGITGNEIYEGQVLKIPIK
ncbi:LysM peptidoglycan-binding domain-containing protein [Metabacillus sp. B2-18]|uniref:LysM peptidoglycan-binding domain-containing protein n=1 Tax=Metabacillus sp. B2-18 TaxID=2897333 RepID=UPI001E2CC16F|nr:LysM peptidoglycan-binding domain-containing protein [Metabacillus sp. B2-18]UGB29298.1 LysM peptidoglycan-binding domain-containing protein [Metabacillus sp. B2-18]